MSASPHPYLTDAEIREIVSPLTQPAAIVRWFRSNGYEVKVRPNGMPLVNRANFDAVSAGAAVKSDAGLSENPSTQPNVQAYLDRIAKHSKSSHARQKV